MKGLGIQVLKFLGKGNTCVCVVVVGGLVAKSCPTLAVPWTAACQTPLSIGILCVCEKILFLYPLNSWLKPLINKRKAYTQIQYKFHVTWEPS